MSYSSHLGEANLGNTRWVDLAKINVFLDKLDCPMSYSSLLGLVTWIRKVSIIKEEKGRSLLIHNSSPPPII